MEWALWQFRHATEESLKNALIPVAKFSWLCYITLYNANSLKIPLNYVIFVSLV
jgi:hypothetical protein